MTEAVETTADAPLSVDQAVESLLAPPEDVNDDAAPEVEAAAEETEADPNPAEDASEAEEPGDGGETEEPAEAEAEPVEAPQWWDAEAKAQFAKLTPEARAVVFAQEEKREAVVQKAKHEAAEQRKAAQVELASVQQFAEQLGEFLPRAVETFKKQWGEPDWAAVIEQYGAEEGLKLKLRYEDEQKQLTQIAEAKRVADAQAEAAKLKAEAEKLIGTPLEAEGVRAEVASYLKQGLGYTEDELKTAPEARSARFVMLAHKAMLYDKAQAALKAKPSKPATPAPAKAPVRPAAASAPGAPQQRIAQQAQNRFAQTKSIDDAVAVLLAKKA